MKITKIHLFHVAMPLIEPWVTAYGNQANIESLFVGVEANGLIGWGECDEDVAGKLIIDQCCGKVRNCEL